MMSGGLGLEVPLEICKIQDSNSLVVTKSIVNHVNRKDMIELDKGIKQAKRRIKNDKIKRNADKLVELQQQMNNDHKKLLEMKLVLQVD